VSPSEALKAHPLYLVPGNLLADSHLQVFNFWIQLFVGIGLLVGIVWGGVKFVHGVRKWYHRRHTQEVAAEITESLDPIIGALVKAAINEFLPNGGRSIKDSVTRIDLEVAELRTSVTALAAKTDVVLEILKGG
jgi:hypothetical protein